MKNRIIKPVVLFASTICLTVIILFACSKSGGSSYGGNNNGGGNNTPNSVSIVNFTFSSSSLTVTSGTKVTWTNNDATTHTVTADDGSFDSGNIAPGGTFSHTFNSAGTYAYHCNIHTTMKGKIVVN
ncbi:MAG TPA: cupredoxin family copper-binding protein [Parafilimonas sp.]|nr:cupredoxin family copper-binding protein [Parafilimonas sp.]